MSPPPAARRCRRGQRVDDRVEVAVEHLVEVVRLEADPVVGDPVLREVVGADALGAVDGADLAAPRVAAVGGGLLRRGGQQARAQDPQRRTPCSAAGSSRSGSDDDAAGQVGDAHGGVGGVDALPARPGGAEDVDAQVVRVDARRRPPRPPGSTRTPAADVWMRPWDSVTGTRWTRCTPPSNFSRRPDAPRRAAALTATATSLYPPRSDVLGVEDLGRQPRRSA